MPMDADEREIFYYLRGEQGNYVSAHSISRHAGGKHKYRESPDWARPALLRMAERGILEIGPEGDYRLKPIPVRDPADKSRHWVSPQIAALLRKRNAKFEDRIHRELAPEDYYDSL